MVLAACLPGDSTAGRVESGRRDAGDDRSAVTSASIAAHREQVTTSSGTAANRAPPAPAPLTDRPATDDGLPLVLVLVGVSVPLGVLIVALGKPVLSYRPAPAPPDEVA
jgi:hypothetical protein